LRKGLFRVQTCLSRRQDYAEEAKPQNEGFRTDSEAGIYETETSQRIKHRDRSSFQEQIEKNGRENRAAASGAH